MPILALLLIRTPSSLLSTPPPPADLEIWIGQNRLTLPGHARENLEYFSIQDLGRLVGFTPRESGNTLRIEGSRGTLQLVDGRTLVRASDEYIALSSPVWRRGEGDWLVTEDFLSQVLPLAVGRTIERVSDRRYRLQELERNLVRVEVANQPASVQVAFFSSKPAPVRVREFNRFIQVDFDRFLVDPEFPDILPNRRLVLSVEFDSSSIYGGFRIQKGEDYAGFREHTLTDPDRQVVEIYSSLTRSAPDPGRDRSETVSTPLPAGGAATPDPDQTILGGQAGPPLIAIDPGHGGQDIGVLSPDGLAEKDLAMALAAKVGRLLEEQGFRILLTRNRDVDLAVEQRSSIGNYYQASLFLSLHIAASPSPESLGPVVYVNKFLQESQGAEGPEVAPPPKPLPAPDRLVPWNRGQERSLSSSRRLAERLQNELNRLWGTSNAVSRVPLALLSPVTAPAVLVEAGYLTNAEDLIRISFPEFQEQVAASIASALVGYLRDEPSETPSNP